MASVDENVDATYTSSSAQREHRHLSSTLFFLPVINYSLRLIFRLASAIAHTLTFPQFAFDHGMKLSTFWFAALAAAQWYPVNRKGDIPEPVSFHPGDNIQLECIERNIDNGEHKFDDKDRIIYGAFPLCKETGKPLSLKYGVSEDVECTIYFSDTLYHLFQIYIHEDAPFSCRLPYSNEAGYLEAGGAAVPLTFNFRGQVTDSKIEVDPYINVLLSGKDGTVVLAVGWGLGTNTTRIVIGDELTLKMAVRWVDLPVAGLNLANTPIKDGWYKLPHKWIDLTTHYATLAGVAVVVAVITLFFTYKRVLSKVKTASWADEEISKKD